MDRPAHNDSTGPGSHRCSREFPGQHTHLSCFFQGTELRDSLGSGEPSARQDAVGVSVIQTALSAGSMTAVDRSPPQLLQKQQDGKFEGGEWPVERRFSLVVEHTRRECLAIVTTLLDAELDPLLALA